MTVNKHEQVSFFHTGIRTSHLWQSCMKVPVTQLL